MKLWCISLLSIISFAGTTQDSVSRFVSLEQALRNPAQVKVLTLKRARLKMWPDSALREFINLKELNLSNNKIKELPADISYLNKLEVLNMANNKLDSLPISIGQLNALKKLHLGNNEIYHVSPALADLLLLEELELWSNNIYYLPAELANLKKLKVLDLRNIQINKQHQADIKAIFSDKKVRIKFSEPCNCG